MVQFKNRYMVMEIFLDSNRDSDGRERIKINEDVIAKTIKDSILLNFGDCGLGLALGSFQVKYANNETKLCIIRISRNDYQKVWSAITMIQASGIVLQHSTYWT